MVTSVFKDACKFKGESNLSQMIKNESRDEGDPRITNAIEEIEEMEFWWEVEKSR